MGLVLCFFSGKKNKKIKINPYFARVQKHKEPWEETPAAHPRANVPPKHLVASPVGQREKTATQTGGICGTAPGYLAMWVC